MKYLLLYGDRSFPVKKGVDVHTHLGLVKWDDIEKAKPGDRLKTNKGKEMTLIESTFIDLYDRIKRGAQIIPRKDIGFIIAETGINKQSVVVETGAGSGAVGCFLASICKKVYSYEIREDFYNLVSKNIEMLGLKNVKLKHQDAKEGFKEKNVDVVILDLPDPWELIENAYAALRPGGFLVSYSPTVPQVMDFVSALGKFRHIKTVEITEREWDVRGRKVRPRSQTIGHSGFMTFSRKL